MVQFEQTQEIFQIKLNFTSIARVFLNQHYFKINDIYVWNINYCLTLIAMRRLTLRFDLYTCDKIYNNTVITLNINNKKVLLYKQCYNYYFFLLDLRKNFLNQMMQLLASVKTTFFSISFSNSQGLLHQLFLV